MGLKEGEGQAKRGLIWNFIVTERVSGLKRRDYGEQPDGNMKRVPGKPRGKRCVGFHFIRD